MVWVTRRRRAAGLLLLAALLPAAPAMAHPHVFVDYAVKLSFADGDVRAVRISWTFDEMYSSMLFSDYTSRPRGTLSVADVRNLEKNAFDDAADHHFFVDIAINGKPFALIKPTAFDARFERHRMTYSFTVPLRTEPALPRNTIEVDVFDTEFYIDFMLMKQDAVTIERGPRVAADCGRRRRPMPTTMFGGVDADVVVCSYGPAG